MSDPARSRSFVAYFRVSTDRQGKSGLGLEAQRKAVADYIAHAGSSGRLVAEFTEVETGKRADRPSWRRRLRCVARTVPRSSSLSSTVSPATRISCCPWSKARATQEWCSATCLRYGGTGREILRFAAGLRRRARGWFDQSTHQGSAPRGKAARGEAGQSAPRWSDTRHGEACGRGASCQSTQARSRRAAGHRADPQHRRDLTRHSRTATHGGADAFGSWRVARHLRPGDVVVVWKLDRLSRSLKDLLHIMETIGEAGASFRSLTEHIDTTTPAGRMMMQMVGAFAEFERP